MPTKDPLILYLTKPKIDQTTLEKIKEIINPDLNWAYFFERTRAEGVASLVYSNLLEIESLVSLIPEDMRREFKSCYYTVATRNALLCQKLKVILTSFNQAKIDIILLKGMALIHSVYPNIALRPMYDIDILIHEKDFPLVESKLKELGYNNSTSYPEDFYKDDIMIDVHWDLMNITRVKSRKKSCKIDLDKIWKSSIPIAVNGQKTRILSPEHCLMGLCLHLTFHHGLQGLMWFVDVARLIEYYENEIDWNKFIEESFEYKIYRPVYYVLFYVKNVLGQKIPSFILDKIEPKKQNFLERKIFDLIMSGASFENIRFFFTFLAIENFFDKLRFLKEIALPSPKMLSVRYNISSRWKIPKCYFLHFKTIICAILKLLRKISFAS